MKTTEHIAPEEMMAWVDEELAGDVAEAVAAHVAECAECAGVAAGFRRLSEQLGEWRVEEAPARLETAVMSAAASVRGGPPHISKSRYGAPGGGERRWMRWALGIGGAMAAAVLLVTFVPVQYREHEARQAAMVASQSAEPSPPPMEGSDRLAATASLTDANAAPGRSQRAESKAREQKFGDKQLSPPRSDAAAAAAPMIARSVSLTVRVQDVDVSRAAVESVLARHHGYAAQMNASTAEGSARAFTASLRIPAADLAAALKELRGLGHVENESQSGEEVTQQHQDLEARLKNSRETETRLQAILERQTGRISDVLDVEQEIARVRGEIESMEADQAALEHRVDFASVDLSLAEDYKAAFGGASDSVGTRLRNSLVEGFRNAGSTVLGLVLLAEEYGPALLVWGILLALPGVWLWRRYRRALAARL